MGEQSLVTALQAAGTEARYTGHPGHGKSSYGKLNPCPKTEKSAYFSLTTMKSCDAEFMSFW